MVMVSEVIIGDGDGSGSLHDVDEPIHAVRHGNMINPDVRRAEYGDPITVAASSKSEMHDGVPDHAAAAGLDVMDVESVDDDVLHELDGDASAVGDMNVGTAAVDGLVAGDEQLLVEVDDHVAGEDDPERLGLDSSVAESAGAGVDQVVVGGVGDDIDLAVDAAKGVTPEPQGAVGELLAIAGPVGAAPPAAVDRVRGLAWAYILAELPSRRVARSPRQRSWNINVQEIDVLNHYSERERERERDKRTCAPSR